MSKAVAVDLKKAWGDEWDEYLKATVRGLTHGVKLVEEQIKAVCYREYLKLSDVGFSFDIGERGVSVEVFLWIDRLDRALSLGLNNTGRLCVHHILETKESLENDKEWKEVAEHRALVSMRFFVADVARKGLSDELNRCLVLIAQFSKIFYQSCSVLKWNEV
ncbi:MAG: hypothetical protein G01um101448_725 [Parcubacteria group bacterium Gr01-1014_48]|nr:MAG: hypothetical protein Greene041614_870 [Parcubacteria group bacterium Greene0416_14]TSC73534.1 MAG: hypothetical protein G01um101448_725 [Parcubacteria group bacterium Gr01-1014_48]TSD00099.1 MAG: hypothetical protein Greene101415_978 [Parcubacteria group bacterium Greene1014_15]TSD07670.1 MAG: hypothetical protein Greene07144_844 [Parcubacteria group bacterium Greene0714_4]